MKSFFPFLFLMFVTVLSWGQAPFDGQKLVPLVAEYETALGPGSNGTPGQTIRAWHILRPTMRDGRHVWEQTAVSRSMDEVLSVDTDIWDRTTLDQVYRRTTRGERVTETIRNGQRAIRQRSGGDAVELIAEGRIVSNGLFNYVGLGTLPLKTGWTSSYRSIVGSDTIQSHRLEVVGLTEVAGNLVWEVTATTERNDGRPAVTRWFVQAEFPHVVQRMEAETADGRSIEVNLFSVHVMDR